MAISINIDEDVLMSGNASRDDIGKDVMSVFAMELFKAGKCSARYGAYLAGMSYDEFGRFLGKHKISVFSAAEEDYKNGVSLF